MSKAARDDIRGADGAPQVLFWGKGTWRDDAEALLLRDPARVLIAREVGEVAAVLEAAEEELGRGNVVAGFFSYEAGAAFGLTTHRPGDLAPLVWLAAFPEANVRALPQASLQPGPEPLALETVRPELNITADEYRAAVAAIKDLIAAGDTYQVNYTCHSRFELDADPLEYFLTLVRSHPVPYAAYLDLGEAQVLSVSPELLLKRRGETLETRPMKGTRRRGRTLEEDDALARELVESAKDRAENLMIVDMMRNDLGRICETGSVQVPALFSVERYRSLWQMTTTVTGHVAGGVTLREIIAATLPGSSVTGAPKRRTMEIIRELEPEPRGVYCGAIGLFMPDGDFTLNLPIRTLVHRAGRFDLGIGSGIVWDSDAQSEYEETLLKSQFAFRVVPDLRLFETMLLTEAREFVFAREHLDRLARSARYWDFPCEAERVAEQLRQFAEAAEVPLVVRIELDQEGELRFSSRPAPAPPEGPVRVLLSGEATDAADRFRYHKTSHRRVYDEARAAALGDGFFEVIFCNREGRLTEGAITNLFVRTGGRWVTPPVGEGLLPGIWREQFMRETGAAEEALPVEVLAKADEVVIGNSVRGAVRVDEIRRAGRALFPRSA